MRVASLLLAIFVWTGPARAGAIEVVRIALTVTDLGKTEAFYCDGLDFRTVERESLDEPATEQLLGVPEDPAGTDRKAADIA